MISLVTKWSLNGLDDEKSLSSFLKTVSLVPTTKNNLGD
jgi:hypothetical protein